MKNLKDLILFYLIEIPKYRFMLWMIKRKGWDYQRFDIGYNPDGFVHPFFKDNGYDETGIFTLYGAYQICRGRSPMHGITKNGNSIRNENEKSN
jgi:hypothetical protein